jgi:cysteine desulfurase/selenocysteine lyase
MLSLGMEDAGSAKSSNFEAFRQLVPLVSTEGVIYLNASFAPPSNLIIHDAITRFSVEALHDPHPKPLWQTRATEARELLARYINAESPDSVAFTRDTTEGLNSFIRGLGLVSGDNVVVLDTEHPNHVYGWMALRKDGVEIRQVPTIDQAERTGHVVAANAETFAPHVDERTRAIGISSVMFHSGQWNDVAGICAAFRPRNIHILVDLTQQVGFAPVDVRALGMTAAAFSLHKGLNCPTGLAALYVDPTFIKEMEPVPPVVGFGAVRNTRADLLVPADPIEYHPNALRYEHANLSLVSATAATAFLKFYLNVMGPQGVEAHLYELGDALRRECKKLGIRIVGPETRKEHAPHLYILDLHDPRWFQHFKMNNVFVTPYRLGIRVSFGFYNSENDVSALTEVLKSGLEAGFPIERP